MESTGKYDKLLSQILSEISRSSRAFTDPEIVDALLLQHIGVRWQVKLKQRFKDIFRSRAWKSAFPIKTTTENERITEQLGGLHSRGIEGRRQEQRESHFLLSQLSSSEDRPSMYDDLLDAPASSEGCGPTPAMIKQKLLQILTTECDLNKTLYGKHAVIRSDLEWFGPSLPHRSILTILEFFGVPEQWLTFFEKFLRAPLRFKQDPLGEVRIRERGTPISYALSVVCGEALLFGMDFAVNQKANGLFLYRMHDDLWLWDSSAEKCAAGWQEMKVYADLVGLKFNESKTGSVCVGTEAPPGLPSGHIRWGFLKFDQDEARFVIDQRDVNLHIVELRRQLNATKSVFGWVNAYNKYMAFFCRNFGGRSAICFGEDHTADVIKTLARIQRELFPDIEGGAVGHLQSVIERRFGIRDLPQGYFYLPISSGGLELHNPMIEAFAVDNKMPRTRTKPGFAGQVDEDAGLYQSRKESWDRKPTSSKSRGPTASGYHAFMSFYEYVSYRETRLAEWLTLYDKMLSVPLPTETMMTPAVETFLNDEDKIMLMDWYEQWVVSLYGEEVVKRFGSLEVVDPTLIPVGMVQLFRASRMKLDE
jgi:hypothetical protein